VQSNIQRAVVLAVSLVIGGLLTMVPFLGWPITLLLLAFGFGVVAARVIAGWDKVDETRLASGSPGVVSATPPAAG
jgi:uncharacterized membrane protein